METEEEMCSHARSALAKRKTLEEIDIHSVDASSDNELGHEAIKDHFADAYNNVADKSSSRGNAKIASILMKKLGYTDEEMRIIGSDANLMQGTGNPHIAANIQVGEVVVDLGSGFGVDAFVAANKVGESGKIIGIDISRSEVDISQKRSIDRGLENIVTFREGDIEDIPLRDSYADCVISNGGFCLVPDKIKAFTEIFRVLKPGGRMSICCTTNRVELPKDVDWPVCMNVFMKLNDIEPMLKKIGFTDIKIDLSNSRMDLWDLEALDVQEEISNLDSKEREKYTREAYEKRKEDSSVHSGSERFQHLEGFDMNELCARVVITAKKNHEKIRTNSSFNQLVRSNMPNLRYPILDNNLDKKYYSEKEWMEAITKSKVIFFGERHNNSVIIDSQMRVLLEISDFAKYRRLRGDGSGNVSLVMEQFITPDQQDELDNFISTGIPSGKMKDMGGFEWEKYCKLCNLAYELGNVKIYAGFPSRTKAVSTVVRDGYQKGLLQAIEEGSLKTSQDYIPGSEEHYNVFESMISGRNLNSSDNPTDDYRRIFPAQILKDCVVSRVVSDRILSGDSVMCLTGHGHTDFLFGIPERVIQFHPQKFDFCTISCAGEDENNVENLNGQIIADMILEIN